MYSRLCGEFFKGVHMKHWIKIKPHEIKLPNYGVYSVTTSSMRRIYTFASGPLEALDKTRNGLRYDETILTVGKE
jgi:hypothetical protein